MISAVAQKPGTTRTLLDERGPGGAVTSLVRRTVLPGGLRVVTEAMPGVRSATIGVWVGTGSRDESAGLSGASHFLEHLLFKGTQDRSAMDISVELDTVGGEFNAFTAKEYTCFHARVLDQDLPLAVDVLGDMVTSSRLSGQDVEAEREVILDEIAMHDDDPDDVVTNVYAAAAWGDGPLGRPIAGTEESIRALTRAQIMRFYRSRYRPENMVVAVAGNVDHAAVVRLVRTAFARNRFLADRSVRPLPVRRADRVKRAGSGQVVVSRPFEQVNILLGVNGLVRTDERRYVLGVLNAALGGGPSSRLFQEVRERRGLAYGVYSFAAHYADAGMVGVAVGCLPSRVDDVLAVVRAELRRVAEEGISTEELERGKGQLRGGLVLGLEDSGSRMSRIAKAELLYDELPGIDEVIRRVDAVTVEDVHVLAKELFAQPETLAMVGPLEEE
ncbi:MAG TPA: pitrilysin family protein [Nocardioidaceae bacterium]|nr:pitrilysin family protein [Nocardioidaceae bacterium]